MKYRRIYSAVFVVLVTIYLSLVLIFAYLCLCIGCLGRGTLVSKAVRKIQVFWFCMLSTYALYLCPTEIVVWYDTEKELEAIRWCVSGKGRKDSFVVISNHQLQTDWIYLYRVFLWLGREETVKIVAKQALRRIPVIGLGMRMFGFVFLERDWRAEKDKYTRRIEELAEKEDFSLLIFPEGTIRTADTIGKARKHVEKTSIEEYKNVLVPRYKGCLAALKAGRQRVCGVIDFSVSYDTVFESDSIDYEIGIFPLFTAGTGPERINIRVDYHPVEEVPVNGETADGKPVFCDWLHGVFRRKDERIARYRREGVLGRECFRQSIPEARTAVLAFSFLLLSVLSFFFLERFLILLLACCSIKPWRT
ncbi:MAG: 1-acylglycerol-3-phosphate acyltransferase [Amphiamblys sp. WSBS2006]|nr:MAG: 1-acylglycerol-3-phosphate acyltransferase [Amphiamblys sp. WSBS2006]